MKRRPSLEHRLERFAIHNLTIYLVGGQGLALLLSLARPAFLGAMVLVPAAVLGGEWWRLLSFLFTPPGGNPIFAAFALYLLWFMGGALEAQWGALRYTGYVLIGTLLTIAAAFLTPFLPATNTYLTTSIFLAFAYLFPRYEIYLFFVIPVQVRWLALLTWAFYGFELAVGGVGTRLLILAAAANFLIFFGRDLVHRARHGHRLVQRQTKAIIDREKPLHVCTVCGVTDKSDRTAEFRYCTKCEPPVAYCMAHLRSHEHRHGEPSA